MDLMNIDWNLMQLMLLMLSSFYFIVNCSKSADKSVRATGKGRNGNSKCSGIGVETKKKKVFEPKKVDKEDKTKDTEKDMSAEKDKEKKDSSENDKDNTKHSTIPKKKSNSDEENKEKEDKNGSGEKKKSNEIKLEKKGSGSGTDDSGDSGPDQPKKAENGMKKEDKSEAKKSGSIDNRKAWALRVSKMKCVMLSKLHKEKLKGYIAPKCTFKICEKNQNLNRYTDVMCIDETRVILKNRENDYIHASYMTMPDKKTTYILTQGPLPETIADFWAMVVQEGIKVVIMLCPLSEGGVEKCAAYYPDSLGAKETYGNFEVKFVEKKEEPVEGVSWSVLNVLDKDHPNAEPYELNHIFVPWWPDQLAPDDPKPVIELYKWMKKFNPEGAPICVHCSAGVGRTATFIGLDYANLRIQENPNIELVDIVREMRSMRFQSVQTHMQFLFLHVCLLEYFCQEGIVERDGSIQNTVEQYKKHAGKKLAKRAKSNEDKEKKSVEE